MLTYTSATLEDVAPLYELNKRLINEYEDTAAIDYPKVLSWVHRNLERNIGFFTRVLWNGQLAGYYCLTPTEGRMELDSLFVLEKFQGHGIGSEVLRKCQAESPALFLYVFRRNTRAIALYKRLGFRVTKEVGTTRYIMEYQKQGC